MTYFLEDIYGAGSYEISISADYDIPIRAPGLIAITATQPGLRVRLPRADTQRENHEILIVNDSTIAFGIVDRHFGAVPNGASVATGEARAALVVSTDDIPGKWICEKLLINAQGVQPDPYGYCVGVGASSLDTYEFRQSTGKWTEKAAYVQDNGTLSGIEGSAQAFGSDLYVHTHAGVGFEDSFQKFDAGVGVDGQWSTLLSIDDSPAPDRATGFHGLATDGVHVWGCGSQEPNAGSEGREVYKHTIGSNTWAEVGGGTGGEQLDDGAVTAMSADKSKCYFVQDTTTAKVHRFTLSTEATDRVTGQDCPTNATEGMIGFHIVDVDRIYVAMGQIGIGSERPITRQVWEFRISTEAWSPKDPVAGVVAPIKNGWSWGAGSNGYVFGGELQDESAVDQTAQYNRDKDVWLLREPNLLSGPDFIINPQMGASIQL